MLQGASYDNYEAIMQSIRDLTPDHQRRVEAILSIEEERTAAANDRWTILDQQLLDGRNRLRNQATPSSPLRVYRISPLDEFFERGRSEPTDPKHRRPSLSLATMTAEEMGVDLKDGTEILPGELPAAAAVQSQPTIPLISPNAADFPRSSSHPIMFMESSSDQ